jgi:lysozyme-like protein
MSLSDAQLAKLAADAGFTGNDVKIAVAVARAESGGNPQAHNATPPDDSYGLWQINMLGALGPDRRRRYNLKSNSSLYDPATNARVAYGIWKGSGWKAWTTYTRGTYKKFLNGSITVPEATPGGNATPASAPPVLGIAGAVNAFGDTVFKGVSNIAGILVAITLVVLGAVFLLRNAVPVGKVAKVVKGVAK